MTPPETLKLTRWLTASVAKYPDAVSTAIACDPTYNQLLHQFDDLTRVPVPDLPHRVQARDQAIKAAGNAVARYVQGQCKALSQAAQQCEVRI